VQTELIKLVDGYFHYFLDKTVFSNPVTVKCPNNQLTSRTKNFPKKKKNYHLFTPGNLRKARESRTEGKQFIAFRKVYLGRNPPPPPEEVGGAGVRGVFLGTIK
jgi:hypothetical protein